jgi:adenylate kinase family enzyme
MKNKVKGRLIKLPFYSEIIMPNKILIFGSVASGKSTLASKLSKKLNIPFYTMGFMVYKSYPKIRFSEKERDSKLKAMLKNKKWILKGVYWKPWILPALKKADFVIILDLPKRTLYYRNVSRAIKETFKGKLMEAKTLKHKLKIAKQYKKDNLIKHKNLVKKYKKKSVILQNTKEVTSFLNNLK